MCDLRLVVSTAVLLFGSLGCSPKYDSLGKPCNEGKTITEWITQSTDGGDSDRATAVSALAEIKQNGDDDPRIIPAIVKALDDEAWVVRFVASFALLIVGHEGSAAAGRLIQLLEDKDARVRRAAVEAIPRIGVPSAVAVPRLIKMLDDDNHIVRIRAAQSLAEYGSDAKAAIPRIEAISLNEELPDGRELAKEALKKIRGTTGG